MGLAAGTSPPPRPDYRLRGLPREVWALGVVSLLMDASSELVHSLLPILMASLLGASAVTIGIIEGVAEATASVTKILSGALSDAIGKRKPLVVLGYALAALCKPVFPLAGSIAWVFGARFADRVGKGIRGAPRDALLADITPPSMRGAAYGLRQSLDSVGAFLGPLMAIVLLAVWNEDIRLVLWAAVVPALLAVVVLVAAVREPDSGRAAGETRTPLAWADIARLPRQFWLVVAVGAVFTLARFSEAFLILRADDVGLALAYVPAVMILMNVVYAGVAYPAGRAADRYGRRQLLVWGLAALVVADLILAVATTPVLVFAGTAFWGLHMGLTQGLLSALVADTAPARIRGSAFGIFNIVTGVALLVASVTAGALWSTFGPSATFLAGGLFAAVAMIGASMSGPRS